jgi:ABC-2 type transport system permease protein
MASIFNKAFRDSKRTMIWLSIGLGLYILMMMSIYPSLAEQADEISDLMDSYPESIMRMFYSGDVSEFNIVDPGIFLQTYVGTWGLLILGAIVIVQAFNAFTNAERDGTMDMTLSLPVSRRDLLVGRALNTAVTMLVVLVICALTVIVCAQIWPEFDAEMVRVTLALVGAIFPLMVVAGFTYLLAVWVPSSRRFAGPIAYLFFFGSYLIHGLAGTVESLDWIRSLMLFNYYDAGSIVNHGVDITDWLILAAVAAVYFGLAWWLVDRKELGV